MNCTVGTAAAPPLADATIKLRWSLQPRIELKCLFNFHVTNKIFCIATARHAQTAQAYRIIFSHQN